MVRSDYMFFSNKIAVFFYCVVGTHFMVYVNIFRDLMVLIAAKFVMDQPAITEMLQSSNQQQQ